MPLPVPSDIYSIYCFHSFFLRRCPVLCSFPQFSRTFAKAYWWQTKCVSTAGNWGQRSQQWGREKKTIMETYGRIGIAQKWNKHRTGRLRGVLEVDVPVNKPSVGHRLCLQFALSSFSTTAQLLSPRWTADWSVAYGRVWRCASRRHTQNLYLAYRIPWPACHPCHQRGLRTPCDPRTASRNTRLSWLLDSWFSWFVEPVEASWGLLIDSDFDWLNCHWLQVCKLISRN